MRGSMARLSLSLLSTAILQASVAIEINATQASGGSSGCSTQTTLDYACSYKYGYAITKEGSEEACCARCDEEPQCTRFTYHYADQSTGYCFRSSGQEAPIYVKGTKCGIKSHGPAPGPSPPMPPAPPTPPAPPSPPAPPAPAPPVPPPSPAQLGPPYTCSGCFCTTSFSAAEIQRQTVQYSSSHLMDIYLPPNQAKRPQRPAAIVIHGGYFKIGSRESFIAAHWSSLLAQHGFVAASIDYTLTCSSCKVTCDTAWNGAAEANAALQYLRDHASELGVDASRMFAFGDSAGADIVAAMVVGKGGRSSSILAGVSMSGTLICRNTPIVLGGAQPHATEPPFLDFHCRGDDLNPYAGIVDTVSRIKQAGAFGDIITFSDAECSAESPDHGGHDPWRLVFADMSDVIGFLYQAGRLATAPCPRSAMLVV